MVLNAFTMSSIFYLIHSQTFTVYIASFSIELIYTNQNIPMLFFFSHEMPHLFHHIFMHVCFTFILLFNLTCITFD